MGILRWASKAALNTTTLGGYSAGKAGGKALAKGVATHRCRHCGTRSARQFPVCPACGREKAR